MNETIMNKIEQEYSIKNKRKIKKESEKGPEIDLLTFALIIPLL